MTRMQIRPQIFLITAALATASVAWATSEPLLLTVEPRGASNTLFRVKNAGTNDVRLPSDGYAFSGYFFPANTNPPFAIIEHPMVSR